VGKLENRLILAISSQNGGFLAELQVASSIALT